MKCLLLIFALFSLSASGQFYYKDIVVTRQTNATWQVYKNAKVKQVRVGSFDATGQPVAGFDCRQAVSSNFGEIRTTTASSVSTPSSLVANYNSLGQLVQTIDTSDTYQSSTMYTYDAEGRVLSIRNTSLQTDNLVKNTEDHIWRYDAQGRPAGMLKIKNSTDTTTISFVIDDKGNMVEEHQFSHRLELPAVYYYYNADNFLTDVVRFNAKANRLLPDYIFTPNDKGVILTMLFLPSGTNQYQQWVYTYNEQGLRLTETCYSKRKELIGKIDYSYEYYR